MKNFKKSCNRMTDLIESCYDINNPEDGLTFDERLAGKLKGLSDMDRKTMQRVIGWC